MGPALRYQQPGTGGSAERSDMDCWIINGPESRSGFVFASSKHAPARLPAAALGSGLLRPRLLLSDAAFFSFYQPFPLFSILQSPCFPSVLLPPEKSLAVDRP